MIEEQVRIVEGQGRGAVGDIDDILESGKIVVRLKGSESDFYRTASRVEIYASPNAKPRSIPIGSRVIVRQANTSGAPPGEYLVIAIRNDLPSTADQNDEGLEAIRIRPTDRRTGNCYEQYQGMPFARVYRIRSRDVELLLRPTYEIDAPGR
jgi:hypothetical protein